MLDTVAIKQRKPHQHQNHYHHQQQQQQQQQLTNDTHNYSSTRATSQVFETTDHHPPKWQIFKQNSGNSKPLYEHTNKSDDSLELMPTIAMGYENSIDKKIQRHGELRITGDGYFFDPGYEEQGAGYYGGERDARYGSAYGDDVDYSYYQKSQYGGGNISPGGRIERESPNRNRIHPAYHKSANNNRYEADTLWRDESSSRISSSNSDRDLSKNYSDNNSRDEYRSRFPLSSDSAPKPPFDTTSLQRSRRSYGELHPQMTTRDVAFERAVSSERAKAKNNSDFPGTSPASRKTSQRSEHSDPSSPGATDISSIPLQNAQNQTVVLVKSPKKKGLLKKIFNGSDGKRSKKSALRRGGNHIEESSGAQLPPMITEPAVEEEVVRGAQEFENSSHIPDGDDANTGSITNVISNFPIISNIFNKIDESSMPNHTKFFVKALMLFWIFYEINAFFEIIGDWFRMFGSLFTTKQEP